MGLYYHGTYHRQGRDNSLFSCCSMFLGPQLTMTTGDLRECQYLGSPENKPLSWHKDEFSLVLVWVCYVLASGTKAFLLKTQIRSNIPGSTQYMNTWGWVKSLMNDNFRVSDHWPWVSWVSFPFWSVTGDQGDQCGMIKWREAMTHGFHYIQPCAFAVSPKMC